MCVIYFDSFFFYVHIVYYVLLLPLVGKLKYKLNIDT